MAHNSLAPGFVKISYTHNLLEHVMTVPVKPSGAVTPGFAPQFFDSIGGVVGMSAAVSDYVDVLKPCFGADTNFSFAEFWSQPLPTDNPIWVWTEAIGEVGTGTAASADLLQCVTTFRTSDGGIYRNYLMEITGDIPPNYKTTYPFGAGVIKNLSDYLVSDDSWIFGRDNARLIVPIGFTTKYNDALRKKRGLA